jgi:hypothetical protein
MHVPINVPIRNGTLEAHTLPSRSLLTKQTTWVHPRPSEGGEQCEVRWKHKNIKQKYKTDTQIYNMFLIIQNTNLEKGVGSHCSYTPSLAKARDRSPAHRASTPDPIPALCPLNNPFCFVFADVGGEAGCLA